MSIEVRLDLVLVKMKRSLTELSERIGISLTNLSLLKTGKVKGIRFGTLDSICREMECQPGDLLVHVPEDTATGDEEPILADRERKGGRTRRTTPRGA